MRRRHQTRLPVELDPAQEAILIGPSQFRPGTEPHRFRSDPRATSEWRRIRKVVLNRDRSTCRQCGQPATDVDHRMELIDGGDPYSPANLQSLCSACHDAKSSEARYRRTFRASSRWGRLALCPKCSGTGQCTVCRLTVHPCTFCLGLRFVPERFSENGEIPSQSLVAEVSSIAWAGVERPIR